MIEKVGKDSLEEEIQVIFHGTPNK
jgi:hypothetical protein